MPPDPTPSLAELADWADELGHGLRRVEQERADPAPAEITRLHDIEKVEALLVDSGLQLYRLVITRLARELEHADTIPPVLASLLAQTRSTILRGLRQPDKITRHEALGAAAVAGQPRREGEPFDYAGFLRLFLDHRAGPPGHLPARPDRPALPLAAPHPDD